MNRKMATLALATMATFAMFGITPQDIMTDKQDGQGELLPMYWEVDCYTNVTFDNDGVCRHEVVTNIYSRYRSSATGKTIRFDPAKIDRIWTAMHNRPDGLRALHGEKGKTVITNIVEDGVMNVYRLTFYADGYVHKVKAVNRNKLDNPADPFKPKKKAKSHTLPSPYGKKRGELRCKRLAAMKGTNYVNAVFGPGGKLVSVLPRGVESEDDLVTVTPRVSEKEEAK